jgi:DUF4097 and DUF4098 domain-containing protein YvlB
MTARATIWLALALAVAMPAGAAERNLEMRLAGSKAVEIRNLIGMARLVPGREELVIRAVVQADERSLADEVRFQSSERRGAVSVIVEYPASVSSFRYDGPRSGRFESSVDYDGRKLRVSSSRGELLQVDLEIEVPAGMRLRLHQDFGPIGAEGVDAELALVARRGDVRVADGVGRLLADTGSGRIEVSSFRGDVAADSGSGSVRVENVLGRVKADTGSGSVKLRGIDGDIVADTGSGSVEITDARADRIAVDTGSGGVRFRDVAGSLHVDTGSGSVRGEGVAAGSEVQVDTGSGSVTLTGDLGGVQRLVVDTGSGSVELRSDSPLAWRLDLSSGSGGFKVDLPSLSNVESSRRRFRAVSGTGSGTAKISTGSGSIRIAAP